MPGNSASRSPRIVLAVTVHSSLQLLKGFPEHLAREGWDVHVVSSPGAANDSFVSPRVSYHTISMARGPHPAKDLLALIRWIKLLRRIRPDVVSVGTPKAALLGSLAARVVRVPRLVYLLRGLRYESAEGFRRSVLIAAERITAGLADSVVAVSRSLKDVAVDDGICDAARITVIGAGSSNGVDFERFAVSDTDRVNAKRTRWATGSTRPVVGYIGRIHQDKGVGLLADALSLMDSTAARVLVVGAADGPDGNSLVKRLLAAPVDVEFVGSTRDVVQYLRLMDVLCLPTKREGFPNVVLEAAAAGVPTVATAATGIPDAILDGETGVICEMRDPATLAAALESLIADAARRAAMGDRARQRAHSLFQQEDVWAGLNRFYGNELLKLREPGLSRHTRSNSRAGLSGKCRRYSRRA